MRAMWEGLYFNDVTKVRI